MATKLKCPKCGGRAHVTERFPKPPFSFSGRPLPSKKGAECSNCFLSIGGLKTFKEVKQIWRDLIVVIERIES